MTLSLLIHLESPYRFDCPSVNRMWFKSNSRAEETPASSVPLLASAVPLGPDLCGGTPVPDTFPCRFFCFARSYNLVLGPSQVGS
jgi:hypothetical protein